jgi:hypothetical protein
MGFVARETGRDLAGLDQTTRHSKVSRRPFLELLLAGELFLRLSGRGRQALSKRRSSCRLPFRQLDWATVLERELIAPSRSHDGAQGLVQGSVDTVWGLVAPTRDALGTGPTVQRQRSRGQYDNIWATVSSRPLQHQHHGFGRSSTYRLPAAWRAPQKQSKLWQRLDDQQRRRRACRWPWSAARKMIILAGWSPGLLIVWRAWRTGIKNKNQARHSQSRVGSSPAGAPLSCLGGRARCAFSVPEGLPLPFPGAARPFSALTPLLLPANPDFLFLPALVPFHTLLPLPLLQLPPFSLNPLLRALHPPPLRFSCVELPFSSFLNSLFASRILAGSRFLPYPTSSPAWRTA